MDSTDAAGATFKGNGSLTAPTLALSGNPGYSTSGGNVTLNATIQSNQPPTADPLYWLPQPSGLSTQSNSTLKITSKNSVTLSPGIYIGGISISGQGNVTMNPGIYYMENGGFSITGQGNLTGTGVMIYSDGTGGTSLAGKGTMSLSPPTSGIYTGITIFEKQSGSQEIDITGNGMRTSAAQSMDMVRLSC